MNPYWIVVAFSTCVQLFVFLRCMHRRTRDDEIRRAFIRDMAINLQDCRATALQNNALQKDQESRPGCS